MATIVIIEDEKDIRELMGFQLKAGGHEVLAFDQVSAFEAANVKADKVDLIILDWMLPGPISGIAFCRDIKSRSSWMDKPIIMVTALTQSENIVQGLDAGADDYITKPFDLHVFKARVRAQLRNLEKTDQTLEQLIFGSLKINLLKCKVFVDLQEIVLTSTEYKILITLAEKPGHVFTREQMISKIQGENIFVTGRTVDTHIAGLRKKLGSSHSLIETIRGIGYRFSDDNKT
jgi:DNA-binding response OmpR family regulator